MWTHIDRGRGFTHFDPTDGSPCPCNDEPRLVRVARGLKTYKRKARQLAKEQNLSKERAEYEVLDDIFDDLPDGAYFAAMAEHGFEAEDIIEMEEERTEDNGRD